MIIDCRDYEDIEEDFSWELDKDDPRNTITTEDVYWFGNILRSLNEYNLGKNSDTLNGIEVFMHTREGNQIPHFHFRTSNRKEGCIQFNDNRYFSHGSHQAKLTKEEMKNLNDWLGEINKKTKKTNWESLYDKWNEAHNVKNFEYPKMPDYSTIKEYKEK